MASATKNDDSESNLSVDSNLNGKKLHIAVDQHIAIITRPKNNVLLFLAMCVNLHDLEVKVLTAAKKWIDMYDDESREFKNLLRKGLEISNL